VGEDAGGHDWWHAERVARLALILAQMEGADVSFCVLVAAVHDVIDYKVTDNEEQALQNLSSWLAAQGLAEADVCRVGEVAARISFKGGEGEPMTCLEGRIVQDADRLDSLGAIGLARSLAFGGTIGRPIHVPGIEPRFGMSAAEYLRHRGTSMSHIRERIDLIRDRLNTPYARELAIEREKFIFEFLDRFTDEWACRR